MNKTFLLVAVIFAAIGALSTVSGALQLFGLKTALELDHELVGQIPEEVYAIVNVIGVILLVFAVLNVIAAIRINAARQGNASRKEALGWSIYLLFGAGLIGGIFGIMGANAKNSEVSTASNASNSLEVDLKALDSLYNKGLISQEEYQDRRSKLLGRV